MKKIVLTSLTVAALLGVAGCSGTRRPEPKPAGLGNSSTAATKAKKPVVAKTVIKTVALAKNSFIPASLTVKKGTTVLWINRDKVPHTITGDGWLTTQTILPAKTYTFTFKEAGTFELHSTTQSAMKGAVIVPE